MMGDERDEQQRADQSAAGDVIAPEIPPEVKQSMLLRWAVENLEVKEGHNEGNAAPQGMDPVHKAEAMKSIKDLGPEWYEAIFGKSDVDVMKEMINHLERYESDPNSVPLEQVVGALEQIGFLVELTHNANDFPKLGGLNHVMKLLGDEHEDVRLQVCWIVGKSASNNPEYQEKILGTDVLPRLIKMLTADPSRHVQAKALHAVSSIVRHSAPAMKLFTANGGFRALGELLSAPVDRNVLARTVFFMTYCLGADASATLSDMLLAEGLVVQVLSLLKHRDFDLREKIVVMLNELAGVGGHLYKAVMESLHAKRTIEEMLIDEEDWQKEEPDNDHFDLVELAKQLITTM
eukprot:TRINITY_DN778_c0_g1_i1.p1 TRINITY_DN778_c0_g1~~TRINITY_DN778_c0_g1_i1.p1  ORF type:complete len:348 (-),score=119.36 TRINITY_DN778_c0_g1_i1:47-1090(-)